MLNGMMESVIG
jgi:hypothetical protein